MSEVNSQTTDVVREFLALQAKMWDAGYRVAALDFLRQGVGRFPGDPRLTARLAVHARSLADWRDGDVDVATLAAVRPNLVPSMTAICMSDDAALHRASAVAHAARGPAPALPVFRHAAGEMKHKLRIGYISPDFRDHPMGQCMAEVFERHDRRRFDVIGYSLRGEDCALRARIDAGFDRVVDLATSSEAEAAARIHADGIDILIELIGVNTFAGWAALASRPAPVQVSLLGFPGTKAAPFIDYLIGDPVVLGEGANAPFTETLVELPETYYPTDSTKAHLAPLVRAEGARNDGEARTAAGLPPDAFVFCCFNYPHKITPEMFGVWMHILQGVHGAVLWLLEPWPGVAPNLQREAKARGVDPARIVCAPRLPPAEHLARLPLADLALDTLPCGAHTTAVDALWAGVPMLTCLGKSFAGRVGASLLNAIGLPELIVRDLEGYEALAVRLAREPRLLAGYRARLAANRRTAPLFDCAHYTRHLETAYETMWAIHCQGDGPRAFGVLSTRHCRT
jgi:predicted O-linked N-acetylglucosamine transferase (SPINDLY family)